MPKKERQKRSARQARAQERARLEAAHEAAGVSSADAPTKGGAAAKAAEKKPAKAEKKPGRIRTYFRDVKAEMHRVVWPSREELKNYTIAVTALLIVFGVCVWLVDTGVVALMVGFTGLRG